MDWMHFEKYKAYYLVLAGVIAAVAALAANIESIIRVTRGFLAWLRQERFEQPILLSLRVIGLIPSKTGLDPTWEASHDSREYGPPFPDIITISYEQAKEERAIAEGQPRLLDITISYEGDERLLFDRIEIRHWPGRLLSMSTGKLASKGKYRFSFSYNSHLKYDLDPPLVLNPASASLLRFQVDLIPQGGFPSTGGFTSTKLLYRTGKGRVGVIPLIKMGADAYKDFPDTWAKLLRKGQFEFPIFESPNPDKSEIFKLAAGGAIRGKQLR